MGNCLKLWDAGCSLPQQEHLQLVFVYLFFIALQLNDKQNEGEYLGFLFYDPVKTDL